ncbi:MAG: hypothetical protein HYX59_05105 [Elusimicrobia bacterium]|nr:hypothetical protein [Elusimicrobiota bacterium]
MALLVETANNADATRKSNPSLPPEETTRLKKEKAAAVEKIEGIANAAPKDTETQLEVSKSLASVEEAPRAIPYAERGLRLAEASGDKKMIREALLTGSEVFYKAGDYALARERAQRILHDNPKDKDALALYMQVKDRGAASAGAPSGGAKGSGGGAAGSGGGYAGSGPGSTPGTRGPDIAMTDAALLEAKKQIALGWSRIKLDPKAALKNFEAAITAAPRSAAVRVERSKARLAAGDAPGALGDSDDAIALDPSLGDGYAARVEARRALGIKEMELLVDLETAAKLDPSFAEQYKALKLRVDGPSAGGAGETGGVTAGASAPDAPRPAVSRSTQNWGLLALVALVSAALGGVIVPLLLKRRRSDEDGSPPR